VSRGVLVICGYQCEGCELRKLRMPASREQADTYSLRILVGQHVSCKACKFVCLYDRHACQGHTSVVGEGVVRHGLSASERATCGTYCNHTGNALFAMLSLCFCCAAHYLRQLRPEQTCRAAMHQARPPPLVEYPDFSQDLRLWWFVLYMYAMYALMRASVHRKRRCLHWL
jgi:hypothetical protein